MYLSITSSSTRNEHLAKLGRRAAHEPDRAWFARHHLTVTDTLEGIAARLIEAGHDVERSADALTVIDPWGNTVHATL